MVYSGLNIYSELRLIGRVDGDGNLHTTQNRISGDFAGHQ